MAWHGNFIWQNKKKQIVKTDQKGHLNGVGGMGGSGYFTELYLWLSEHI